jgi:hypothetical protein
MDFADWTDSRYNNQEKVKFAKSVFKKRKRNMKTNKFIAIMLLGVLATACSKDGNNRLTLLAEGFTNGNSKVLINDPNHPDGGATWITDETIKLNGNVYSIALDGEDYRLKDNNGQFVGSQSGDMTALYPGSSFGGNDVTVDDDTIILNRLVVNMKNDGKQEIAFPMVAKAAADETDLYFYHLSGGIQVTLHANTAVDIASLKIVAQSTTEVNNIAYNGVTARWAVQGPSMPTGNVGQNGDVVDVRYISEMNFDLKRGTNNYVTVNGDLVFCVPITIASMKKLVFTGYDVNGAQLFHVTKTFDSDVEVVRNKMYTVPIINVN